jgi:ferric-dicitrate binding protein FerR (iron transport regulator)
MASTEQKLEALIRKYYDGESSLEEEQELMQAFQQGHGSVEDRAQFLYFQQRRAEQPSASQMMQSHPDPRFVSRRTILRIAAVIVVAIGIGWIFSERYLAKQTTLSTTEEMKSFVLPDSSRVWLNEMSELSYGDEFDAKERVVTLRGEAYFEVTKDPSKPFIIHTGAATTKVLGTSFNLRSYPAEPEVELTVMEGSVDFGSERKIKVRGGESATFDERSERVALRPVNVNATAWKTGQLYFKNTPLGDVLHDLERYYGVKLDAEPPALRNCHITLSLDHAQPWEAYTLIAQTLNVTYNGSGGAYIFSGETNCGL